ncbi:ABC transporter permease [Amycolatopsis sp. NPDC005961]|uniref:ABC transporter permease n=1 Tax=Amycolatopsis sp. NPDC005961 TaxID=3156720 RepID=UPI0033FEB532
MTTAVLTAPAPTAPDPRTGVVDSRPAYLSFGLAYVLGHGASALDRSGAGLPSWLPTTLLALGLAAGTLFSVLAVARSQRGAGKPELLAGKLLGLSWAGGFAALFLAITALTSTSDNPELATVLWPAGSGLVVGLLYLGEGAVRRNVLHYCLGTWLALVSAAALFFGTPGVFWVLAVAGGGGYAVAAHFERGRLAGLR